MPEIYTLGLQFIDEEVQWTESDLLLLYNLISPTLDLSKVMRVSKANESKG